jgi:serine/threonine protein kinase
MEGDAMFIPHELGDYLFLSPVSELVWIGSNKHTNAEVLIRVFPKRHTEVLVPQLSAECAIVREIHHPLLAKFLGMLEDENFIYLITDPPHAQTVRDFVMKNGPVSEASALIFFGQFAEIFEEFSRIESARFRVTIDSVYVNDECKITQFYLNFEGTPQDIRFRSPEVISGQLYSQAGVVWSAGLFLYYMTTGRLPFDGEAEDQIRRSILQSHPEIPSVLSPNLAALLGKMLTKNPITRLKMSQVAAHPWMKDAPVQVKAVFVQFTQPSVRNAIEGRPRIGSSGQIKPHVASKSPALGSNIRVTPKRSFAPIAGRGANVFALNPQHAKPD